MRALYNGGTEQVMVNLAGEFQRRGLAVTFLVDIHNAYSPFNERLPKGVNFVALGAHGMLDRYKKLKAFLVEHKPPAMISAGYFPNIFAIIATRAAKTGTKLV